MTRDWAKEAEDDSPIHPFRGLMGVCFSCGYNSDDWRHRVDTEWFDRHGWTWDGTGWNPGRGRLDVLELLGGLAWLAICGTLLWWALW